MHIYVSNEPTNAAFGRHLGANLAQHRGKSSNRSAEQPNLVHLAASCCQAFPSIADNSCVLLHLAAKLCRASLKIYKKTNLAIKTDEETSNLRQTCPKQFKNHFSNFENQAKVMDCSSLSYFSLFPPTHRTAEPPNRRTAESPNRRTAELPNCRTAELPNCRSCIFPANINCTSLMKIKQNCWTVFLLSLF
jgi:hypothetical protein